MKKKFLTLALAAVMAFSMSITAFADEEKPVETTDVTINVSNVPEGAKIMYGQVVEAANTAEGWKFLVESAYTLEDLEKYGIVADYVDENGKFVDANDAKLENGEMANGTYTSEIAAVASAYSQYAKTPVEGGKVEVKAGGLYVFNVVDASSDYAYVPMLVYVPVNSNAPVTLKAKGSEIKIDKVAKAGSTETVYSKEELEYTVKTTYPYFGSHTGETFKVVDTLTNATFNDGSVVVKIDGTAVTTGFEATIDPTNTLTVDFTYDSTLANKPVVITYKATATEFTAETTEYVNNEVKFTKYTPSAGQDSEKVLAASKVVSPTTPFTVFKTDAEGAKLENAEFALYQFDKALTEEDGKYTIPAGTKAFATATTDKDGLGKFYGLDVTKFYYVVETKAPAGYSLNTNVYALSGASLKTAVTPVQDTSVTEYKLMVTTYEIEGSYDGNGEEVAGDMTVIDTKLSSLPFTGGIGTTIFTVLGVVIMVAAAALYFATKKKSANK